jgi:hypothetical protein
MLQTSLRRFAGWLILCSLIVTQSVALMDARHGAFDDTACLEPGAGIAGSHHAGGTQFENILPSPPLEHCAFCHLQRAFSSARPGSFTSMVLPPLSAAVTPEPATALASGVRPAFAPRGPPVLS